jgi:hypothetical protein
MNSGRPPVPHRVPTLTEVVEAPLPAPAAFVASDESVPLEPPQQPRPQQGGPDGAAPARPAVAPSEDQLIERVLADLQRQVELMLEYRMREVLAPALARATESLVRDARIELASTLRDMVARAVAQEMSRHRGR